MTVRFADTDCVVQFERYAKNGRPAIVLVDPFDGCYMATATINDPDLEIPEGMVLIKDYSENTGMLKALVDSGLIEHTGSLDVPWSYAPYQIARILKPEMWTEE